VEGFRALRLIAVPCAALVALGIAACGGGTRQDAAEPSGTYRVRIVSASFPLRQHVAAPARLVVEVRNTSRKTVPDIAVTVDSPTRCELSPRAQPGCSAAFTRRHRPVVLSV